MALSHCSVTRAVVCGPLRRSVRRRPCELRRPWAYLSGAVRFAQLPLTRTPLTPILNEYKREREARMGIPFLILYLPRSPVQVHTHWGQARVGPVPLLRDQGLHRRVHTELELRPLAQPCKFKGETQRTQFANRRGKHTFTAIHQTYCSTKR